MVLPLVVIYIHQKAAHDPDYQVSMDDVISWESKHGPVPEGSFVALRTDWSRRWPNMTEMLNKDINGTSHYPGWSMEVLRYLFEDRSITAIGHETTDTDPGFQASRDNYALESYVLGKDHYQIELLACLDRVPEYGALIVVTFPRPQGGSGFPARALQSYHNMLCRIWPEDRDRCRALPSLLESEDYDKIAGSSIMKLRALQADSYVLQLHVRLKAVV